MSNPTLEKVKELIVYFPKGMEQDASINFLWRCGRTDEEASKDIEPKNIIENIDQFSRLDENNFLEFQIENIWYKAADLAWFYTTGEWPENSIKFKDDKFGGYKFSNLEKN